MANPEHLRILKQGVEVWNQWKKDNPDIQPNLGSSGVSASLYLTREELIELLQGNVVFEKNEANLSQLDLFRLYNRNIVTPDLSGMNLNEASLSHAYFLEAKLRKVNLSKASLSFADLSRVDLSYSNLTHAWINNACLEGANLRSTNLKDAELYYADLTEASLSRAILNGAKLHNAHFNSTRLKNTNFSGAVIGRTSFSNVDLSIAKGLEDVKHEGPSSIGIDTIYRSKGLIPEVFLRKAGVPDTFITFSKSLIGKAFDFYSCFISFTESDDLFSERVYNDLQSAGVRCWRWKEDAKWGKALMRSIDEAVHVYDKLVVICSKASLNSPAVIREIERALQKEDDFARRGEDSEVLFPIRLDDYIFTGWNHHRKADVLAKNVGDFRQWREPEVYRESLARLVRDLKA
jgi:uncharacterized protein YjbI with pentapeptide repeats